MRILVTGGAGFIGSNLVHALVGGGHEVSVIDDLSTGTVGNLHPAATLRTMDVTAPGLAEAVAELRPEAVVHLAAQVDVARSVANPDKDRRVNVDGTRAVAAAARESGARLMLFSSSAAVYGAEVPVPTLETAAKGPANPYGLHKLEAESVLAEEFGGDGRDLGVMRFSNVYGPRQSYTGEGGVVAVFANKMLAGETPVVYGDGGQTRDFVYVGDVVRFIMDALDSKARLAQEGPDGPAFNVSTGASTTVDLLAGLMREISGYEGVVEHAAQRPGDVRHSTLDPTKALEVLGWRASAELYQGLTHTIAWFARRPRS